MHLWSWIAHPHVAFNPHFPGVLFSRGAHLVSRTVNDAAKTKRFTYLESDRCNMGRGNRERERIRRSLASPCPPRWGQGTRKFFCCFCPPPYLVSKLGFWAWLEMEIHRSLSGALVAWVGKQSVNVRDGLLSLLRDCLEKRVGFLCFQDRN